MSPERKETTDKWETDVSFTLQQVWIVSATTYLLLYSSVEVYIIVLRRNVMATTIGAALVVACMHFAILCLSRQVAGSPRLSRLNPKAERRRRLKVEIKKVFSQDRFSTWYKTAGQIFNVVQNCSDRIELRSNGSCECEDKTRLY